MKSERRHELQRNALADWLIQTREALKPHMNAILIGVVVLIFSVLAYNWFTMQSAGDESMAWDTVFAAMAVGDTSELEDTVDEFGGTTAASWAAIVAGDLHLAAGCEQLFSAKATAGNELEKAQQSYGRVLESCKDPILLERATFGMARTYEAIAGTRGSQGDLDTAIETYEKVASTWPDGGYAKNAQQRADVLSQKTTREFYDAFALWDPQPAFTMPEGIDGVNVPYDDPNALNVGGTPNDYLSDVIGDGNSLVAPVETTEPEGDTDAPDAEDEAPVMTPADGTESAAEEEGVDEPAEETTDEPADETAE